MSTHLLGISCSYPWHALLSVCVSERHLCIQFTSQSQILQYKLPSIAENPLFGSSAIRWLGFNFGLEAILWHQNNIFKELKSDSNKINFNTQNWRHFWSDSAAPSADFTLEYVQHTKHVSWRWKGSIQHFFRCLFIVCTSYKVQQAHFCAAKCVG